MRLLKHAMLAYLFALLSACYHPPYNNFVPYNRTFKDLAIGATAGGIVGAASGNPVLGATVGAAAIASVGLSKRTQASIIRALAKRDIQYEQYGDRRTLIIPTDRYYLFNLPRLNPLCYSSFDLILQLLRIYPNSNIYVAGFTDNIGTRYHKNTLSQARAETMLTYLWANGIPAKRLTAEGYGEAFAIGDNHIIHGSAYNRRIEIQWVNQAGFVSAASGFKK